MKPLSCVCTLLSLQLHHEYDVTNYNYTEMERFTSPGATLRRERGGGQSQTHGPQEGAILVPCLIPFLKFQLIAGHDTKRADATEMEPGVGNEKDKERWKKLGFVCKRKGC
eukprot:TRINITY_DN13166_c0_g2_i4.p1 TRINITY_DN13166_c0_g2~~TRINITY_DN13166_c0_g2_i4.p1  ORF type:complete len:111 (+),score=24.15 TRINITY_DN13166_c0_g2_i4:1355-1687(+)